MIYKFKRSFSMAHRLYDGPSCKCHTIHGHTWTLHWSVVFKQCINPATGMITPFADLKSKVHKWIDEYVDHSIALSVDDPLYMWLCKHEPDHRILATFAPPTTEVLCLLFRQKLLSFGLDASIVLEETPTNTVALQDSDYCGDAVEQNKQREHSAWAFRDDFSINNLDNANLSRQGTFI